MLVRSPLLTSHKWHELVSSGRLVYRCHDVFLWCYVCFVLLRFRLYAFFVEVAALRSILLRYAGAPIATRVFCLFFCFLLFNWSMEMSLFPSIFCTIAVFSLYVEYVVYLKKNQTTPRPSEHPPVMGKKMSKRSGGIKRLQIQNHFMAFK